MEMENGAKCPLMESHILIESGVCDFEIFSAEFQKDVCGIIETIKYLGKKLTIHG